MKPCFDVPEGPVFHLPWGSFHAHDVQGIYGRTIDGRNHLWLDLLIDVTSAPEPGFPPAENSVPRVQFEVDDEWERSFIGIESWRKIQVENKGVGSLPDLAVVKNPQSLVLDSEGRCKWPVNARVMWSRSIPPRPEERCPRAPERLLVVDIPLKIDIVGDQERRHRTCLGRDFTTQGIWFTRDPEAVLFIPFACPTLGTLEAS